MSLTEVILPNDYVGIQRLNVISDVDKDVVLTLYQPIIGVTATSLYLYLLQQTKLTTMIRMQHLNIFRALNIGAPRFLEAKNKLEAIGLLKTYQSTQEHDEKYIYDVQAPVGYRKFFTDPIYSHLLLDVVGEKQYHMIKSIYRKKTFDLSTYKEITKPFTTVFSHVQAYQDSDVEQLVGNDRGRLQLENKPFDFEFFYQLTKGSYIFPQQLTPSVKQAIQNLYNLYGVTPLEMKNFVLQVHNIEKNTIDVDKLYQVVRSSYQNHVTVNYSTVGANTNAGHVDSANQMMEISHKDKLFKLFKEHAPIDFIYMIKDSKSQNNSSGLRYQVSNSELQVIEQLHNQYKFSGDVINAMIYYVLVTAGNDSLNKAYIGKMANTWVKEEISTVDRAWSFLQERIAKRNDKPVKSGGKVIKSIKLTDEEKKALNEKSTPVQDEWLAILKKRRK